MSLWYVHTVAGADMESLERARLALEGLSVGDAFGECFLRAGGFVPPQHLGDYPDDPLLEMIRQRELPQGRWPYTDDTEMALAIFDVLRARGHIDQNALAAGFARRYATGPSRAYGAAAHHVLQAIGRGASWYDVSSAVFDGTGSMGNGAAMRVAPLGAYFAGDFERAAVEAKRSAEVTHQHPEGQAGAIAVAVAACWAAGGGTGNMYDAVLVHVPAGPTRDGIDNARRLRGEPKLLTVVRELGNGSSVISQDTVPFTLWAADRYADDFEEAMWGTVAALGDADTTCAIVGGIVASTTQRPIPAEWIDRRESLQLNGSTI